MLILKDNGYSKEKEKGLKQQHSIEHHSIENVD